MNLRLSFSFLALAAAIPIPASAGASSYSDYMASLLSGCPTFGPATQDALAMVDQTRQLLDRLSKDADCQGLKPSLDALQRLSSEVSRLQAKDSRASEILQKQSQVENLSLLASSIESSSSPVDQATLPAVSQSLASARVDLAIATAAEPEDSYLAALRRYGTLPTIARSLDEISGQLPELERCTSKHPNTFVDIVGSLLPAVSSVASPAFGVAATSASVLMRDLARYVSQARYSQRIHELDDIQKRNAISCALETVQFARCTDLDGYRLAKWAVDSSDSGGAATGHWSGYDLLVTEMPRLSTWIQRIQTGMEPQNSEEAAFNEKTEQIREFYYAGKGTIQGLIGEAKAEIRSSGTKDERSIGIDLVSKIVKTMLGQSSGSPFVTSSQPTINVFFRVKSSFEMPLFLTDTTVADLEWTPQVGSDPLVLLSLFQSHLEKLKLNLVQIIDARFKAVINGDAGSGENGADAELRRILSDRQVNDAQPLIYEATQPELETSSPYLVLSHLSRWLGDFKNHDDLLAKAFEGYPDKGLRIRESKSLAESTAKAADGVIGQIDLIDVDPSVRVREISGFLQVIKNGDRFLVNRLSKLVQTELIGEIRSGDTPEQIQDILRSSKLELMDKLTNYHPRGRTEAVMNDLQNAIGIHRDHLTAFWKFFSADVEKQLRGETDPTMTARICARLLALPEIGSKIMKACKGTEIRSVFYEKAPADWKTRLSLGFDRIAAMPSEERACAYRDFHRNAYLYEILR